MGVAFVLGIVLAVLLAVALLVWGGCSALSGTVRRLWRAIVSDDLDH